MSGKFNRYDLTETLSKKYSQSMMGHPGNRQPALLSERVADLPPFLETAGLKTLANDPAERFFDLSLFLGAIKSISSPPSTSPFAHSGPSHQNKISSHSTPQELERPETFSSAEVDRAEPAVTPFMSQASIPEGTGIIPLCESLETVAPLITEQEVQEDEERLAGRVAANSADGQRKASVGKIGFSLTVSVLV